MIRIHNEARTQAFRKHFSTIPHPNVKKKVKRSDLGPWTDALYGKRQLLCETVTEMSTSSFYYSTVAEDTRI